MDDYYDPLEEFMDTFCGDVDFTDEDFERFASESVEDATNEINKPGNIMMSAMVIYHHGGNDDGKLSMAKGLFPMFPPTKDGKREMLSEIGFQMAKNLGGRIVAASLIADSWSYTPPEGVETNKEISDWRDSMPANVEDWPEDARQECVTVSVVATHGRRQGAKIIYETVGRKRVLKETQISKSFHDYNVSAIIFGWMRGYISNKMGK